MKYTEDVRVGLASDGMIVHRPIHADMKAEYYVIDDASLYTNDRNQSPPPVSLSRLWLIWFGSLPLLAVLIYLSLLAFGR
jgi:hypothetical protein